MAPDDKDSPEEPEGDEEGAPVGADEVEEEPAWDEGIEDLPEVVEAWDSVLEEAPEHSGGEELGDRIEHDVSRGGVRRTLTVVSAVLLVVLALAIVVAILRSDSDDTPEPVGDRPDESSAPPLSIPDEAETIVVNPVVDPDFTATLDEIVAVEEGSGPEERRIALDVDEALLPAPPGTVAAALLFYDGSPQVLLTGPARWLNFACIQTTVATAELEAVDAGYHDTPTGECGTAGIGRQSRVSCIGDDVIMLDVDLVDAGATSGSERLLADSVRVSLVDFPTDFEKVSLLGTIDVPTDFAVTDLPLARAPLGSELTVTVPTPEGDATVTCLTR